MKTQVQRAEVARHSFLLSAQQRSLAQRWRARGLNHETEARGPLAGGASGAGLSLGRISILPPAQRPGVQAKLTVGEPNDQYEQEADYVAERMMRMPARPEVLATPNAGLGFGMSGDAGIQRLCSECEEEKTVRRKEAGTRVEDRQQTNAGVESNVASRIHAASAGGEPLPEYARSFFEPRFGYDFGNVRIHADPAAAEATQALHARAYTLGSDVVFGAGQYAPSTPEGRRLLAHELTHVVQQGGRTVGSVHADPRPVLRRVTLGNDGPLSAPRQATVRAAAAIAERLVSQTTGVDNFKSKWDAFFAGPAAQMSPKPTLEAYQAAVKGRVVHDMDTTKDPEIAQLRDEEKSMPLERQTGGVTKVGSRDSYLREFAIDQGIDSVASLLIHESLHGAGLSMGPMMMYEPLMHGFEAGAGFPLMMGGADIVDIAQKRVGDTDVDITIRYNLRQIDEPLPASIEVQIVGPESGQVIYQEAKDGSRNPVRSAIPSKKGPNTWIWHARNPGSVTYFVRIVDMTTGTLMASRNFDTDPRCIIGVSTMHCEGE